MYLAGAVCDTFCFAYSSQFSSDGKVADVKQSTLNYVVVDYFQRGHRLSQQTTIFSSDQRRKDWEEIYFVFSWGGGGNFQENTARTKFKSMQHAAKRLQVKCQDNFLTG